MLTEPSAAPALDRQTDAASDAVPPALVELSWPASRASEAVELLAAHCRLGLRGTIPPSLSASTGADDPEALQRHVAAIAGCLGLEVQPVDAFYPFVDDVLNRCGPGFVLLPAANPPRLIALIRRKRHHLEVLTPTGGLAQAPATMLREALCRAHEQKIEGRIDPLLEAVLASPRQAGGVRQALCRELLANEQVTRCWLLRPTGVAPLPAQLRDAGLPKLLVLFLGAHLVAYLLMIAAWWVLGRGALAGRLDFGWMHAWQLLLFSAVAFRLLSIYASGELATQAGAFFKRRLLTGTLQLESENVRHLGYGAMLARVFESELVEFAALSGGLLALTGLFDLVAAGVVLGFGPTGWMHTGLLAGWTVVAVFLAVPCFRRERQWTLERLHLTHTLVEQMIGHRTRVAQLPRSQWNANEDPLLEHYLQLSERFDRAHVRLEVLIPAGWLILALIAMVPAFVGTAGVVPLAIGVGGVVLAQRAFRRLVSSFRQLAAAAIAWERIGLFWDASRQARGDPACLVAPGSNGQASNAPEPPVLDGRDLIFRYQSRGEPILRGTSVKIFSGQRVLLKGHSGSGKSTLAVLLAGVRRPQSGLLLLNGLDRDTLGLDQWRRHVSFAPQFHDNHVFVGTFAFNALLARNWPPEAGELDEAERICRELGLGTLLDRMPGGMQQMVGETGWQLSHGEKSRLYIARALLQRSEVVILDESLAALDPESLARALALILKEARTVIVVAHP